ncbi:MAG: SurA N-terminal domain-containing protein [Thermoproteota archaeon]|nr:SurA N-terminal domain-containing protein [Thermoproteota archaeon]
MGVITWIVIAVVILAIMGLGWQTFFAGVKKGADKVGLTSIVKNITDQAKQSFGGVVKNLSTQNTTRSWYTQRYMYG